MVAPQQERQGCYRSSKFDARQKKRRQTRIYRVWCECSISLKGQLFVCFSESFSFLSPSQQTSFVFFQHCACNIIILQNSSFSISKYIVFHSVATLIITVAHFHCQSTSSAALCLNDIFQMNWVACQVDCCPFLSVSCWSRTKLDGSELELGATGPSYLTLNVLSAEPSPR